MCALTPRIYVYVNKVEPFKWQAKTRQPRMGWNHITAESPTPIHVPGSHQLHPIHLPSDEMQSCAQCRKHCNRARGSEIRATTAAPSWWRHTQKTGLLKYIYQKSCFINGISLFVREIFRFMLKQTHLLRREFFRIDSLFAWRFRKYKGHKI